MSAAHPESILTHLSEGKISAADSEVMAPFSAIYSKYKDFAALLWRTASILNYLSVLYKNCKKTSVLGYCISSNLLGGCSVIKDTCFPLGVLMFGDKIILSQLSHKRKLRNITM